MAKVARGPWLATAGGTLFVVAGVTSAASFAVSERARSLDSTMPGGDAVASTIPEASPSPAASRDPRGVLGTLYRLTDELGSAELYDLTFADRRAQALLNSHWRRHLSPFAGPMGERGRFVQAISLDRRPLSTQIPDREPTSNREPVSLEKRLRDTQTFGLGEGSFDEREAIVMPAPSHIRFSLKLPKQASLRFAPAVLGDGEVTFTVRCRAKGAKAFRELYAHRQEGPSKRWQEVVLPLADCAGDTELELATVATGNEPLVALVGSPVVLGPVAKPLPYNVLFVIVDAMRGDAIAANHDEALDRAHDQAKWPPLDACIGKIPEIAPNIDALAADGTTWQNAWSAAMWTRPATVAMLSGIRSSRLGLSVLDLELTGNERQAFYAKRPPMLPRIFREAGVDTAAVVNNMYLSGSVGVGVDYAFQSLVDHRYQAQDTRHITEDALKYLESRRGERFFLLVNYASPHSPYVPPDSDLKAIHRAKNLPRDATVRNYLAEIHKDDRAIGELLKKLEAIGLKENTLVVVTADHGETMSEVHNVIAVDVAKGVRSGRFTHLSTMWEEAAKVAMVMALPGRLPKGLLSKTPVQTLDLLPTILELEGLPIPRDLDGRSLVPLFSGGTLEDRPVVIEGRGARSIQMDGYRLIVRERVAQHLRRGKDEFERKFELYDRDQDPGERKDIADKQPDLVAKLREQLDRSVSRQGGSNAPSEGSAKYHLKLSFGGRSGRVELRLFAREPAGHLTAASEDLDVRAIRQAGSEVRVSFDANPESATGLDIALSPTDAGLSWGLTLDGKPWPKNGYFGGELGLRLVGAETGLDANLPSGVIESAVMPHIVAAQEFGLFVIREPKAGAPELELTEEAQLEAEQAMQAWGYAKKAPTKKNGPRQGKPSGPLE